MEWMDKIEFLDQKIVLLLNGSNNLYFDPLMWIVTNPIFGIPFYLLFIYLIFKIHSLKKALRVIAVIGITVGLGDLIAHDLIKETIQRYRPSHNIEISNQLNYYLKSNGTFYRGGQVIGALNFLGKPSKRR